MDLVSIARDAEARILSGELRVPKAGEEIDHSIGGLVGKLRIPERPDYVKIRVVEDLGVGFRSIKEENYDEVGARENLDDFLEYIGTPEGAGERVLDPYQLEFKYVPDISGSELPQQMRQDSFQNDNRIILRPVLLSNIYRLKGIIGYDQLDIRYPQGILESLYNERMDFNSDGFCVDLPNVISTSFREYQNIPELDVQVGRFPTWFNARSQGVEKRARIPFEVITQLLEPYTTARIAARLRELSSELIDELEESTYLYTQDKQGELQNEIDRDLPTWFRNIVERGICEEKDVGEALVKVWLIKNRDTFGFSGGDILSWTPETRDDDDRWLVNHMIQYTNTYGPEEAAIYYASRNVWRDEFDHHDDEDEEFD